MSSGTSSRSTTTDEVARRACGQLRSLSACCLWLRRSAAPISEEQKAAGRAIALCSQPRTALVAASDHRPSIYCREHRARLTGSSRALKQLVGSVQSFAALAQCSGRTQAQPEQLQKPAQMVAQRQPRPNQLGTDTQSSTVNMCSRCLHVHTLEPACTSKLRQPFSVMHVALVNARFGNVSGIIWMWY
jgi:hypothetical protein